LKPPGFGTKTIEFCLKKLDDNAKMKKRLHETELNVEKENAI